MTTARIYAAGKVRRWHANPALAHIGQTNADHIGGCIRLLMMLHPNPSLPLIRAVAHHDDGERWVGDLPFDFKRARPEIAAMHGDAERDALTDVLGADVYADLELEDWAWLKMIDRLEAYCHAALYRPDEIKRNGWPLARQRLLDASRHLGAVTLMDVRRLIEDMEAAAF